MTFMMVVAMGLYLSDAITAGALLILAVAYVVWMLWFDGDDWP